MKVLTAALTLFVLALVLGLSEARKGKSLFEFGILIACHTKRIPLDFLGHGIYCGKTPEGVRGRPQTALDGCCKAHDDCYGSAVGPRGPCYKYSPYVRPYIFDVINCKCYGDRTVIGRLNAKCGQKLCKCDYDAAACFAKHQRDLNKRKGKK